MQAAAAVWSQAGRAEVTQQRAESRFVEEF